LAVHRFFTSASDGQINSVPLLKNVSLFWALVIMSLLQLQCATVFLFWWLCQHKGLLWRYNIVLSLCLFFFRLIWILVSCNYTGCLYSD
jgi:hypothetical protein